ncbi:MAG: Xaa-Pro peptidase family protein [Enterocloster citroniae]|nr:Xaa-Pro peptidase family protein [Enterocloster citroniae]
MDQMVISDPSTIFYLTGKFVASGARLFALCLDTQGACTFFINSLQTDYAPLAEGAEIVWYTDSDDSIQILAKKIRTGGTVGIDKNWPSSFLLRLMAAADAKYVLNSGIIDYIRMVKDDGEIQLMRETQAVNEKVISEMFQYVSPELTEQKHHRMLHEMYCAHGADGYNIIGVVAYGKSCGYAHHKPDGTTPVAGDCIMIDAGARLNGYRSDMTRTVFYKSVSDEMRNIYEVVKEAQLTAMDAIKPGMRFCDIDKIGRDIITKYGYGEYFTHRIGHNIGIDGHEFPDVGGANTMEVLPNMTFSVEPGIYIPNLGGVRIEDLVAVTENGYECLNKMSKDLRII